LVPALVLGDTSAVPEHVADRLRDSGLAHLSAVSGANVAIMLVFVLLVLRWAGVRGRTLIGSGLVAVGAFAVLTRLEPSVLRASVMAALLLLAALRGGTAAARQALPAAVLVLLLVDPWLALSPGFALSVAATGGLVLLAPWVLARRRGRLRRALVSALAAQAAVAPLVAGLGGRLDAGGLVANLLAEPLVAPTTVLGLAAAIVAPVQPWVAELLAAAASVPASAILAIADVVASSRWAVLPWPRGPGGALLLAVLLLAGVGGFALARSAGGLRDPRSQGARVRPVAALLVALCLLGVAVLPLRAERAWPPAGWRIVLCDVGQGDAVVLDAGAGRGIVVDAGPDARAVDTCLRDLGIERIPLLVLTHFHADHVAGVPGVLRGRHLDRLLVSPLPEPQEGYRSVREAASGPTWDVAVAGRSTRVGGWDLTVLGPTILDPGEGSAPNNASVLLRAERPGLSILLLGDAELEAQERLLRAVPDQVRRADVLKVPHHGSAVQDPALLRAVGARVALIGVGCGNRYGHPAPSTLALLAGSGASVARTDRHGAVAVLAGGEVVVAGPGPRPPSRCPERVGRS
jgi:competence protein ComEC